MHFSLSLSLSLSLSPSVSLSLPLFPPYSVGAGRRGLEGKERAGSRPPAFPRAPLTEGGGLPAQAAICNILRTAGTPAAPVSKPGVRIPSAFKEKTRAVSLLISLSLSFLLSVVGEQWIWCSQELLHE